MATTNPVQSQNRDADIQRFVDGYTFAFAGSNTTNPPKKSYRNFTSRDIAALETEILKSIRAVMVLERYEITDKMLPDAMSRAEFMRSALRELSRRGVATEAYVRIVGDDAAVHERIIDADRSPFIVNQGEVKPAPTRRVREKIGTLVMHDAVVDIVTNNASGVRLDEQVIKGAGLNKPRIIDLRSDAEAYAFGYAAGTMQQFRNDDALKISISLDPDPKQVEEINRYIGERKGNLSDAAFAQIRADVQKVVSQMSSNFIQSNYCKTVDYMFEPGRFRDNQTAVVLGFSQGRIDARTGLEPSNDRIGLFASCPSSKAATQR